MRLQTFVNIQPQTNVTFLRVSGKSEFLLQTSGPLSGLLIASFVQLLVVFHVCVIFLAASNVFWLIFCIQSTLVKTLYAGPPGGTGEFCPGPQPERGPLNTCLKDRYTLIEQSDLDTLIEQSDLDTLIEQSDLDTLIEQS